MGLREVWKALKRVFFNTRAHAPLPPLFVGVPGTALTAAQPLPSALYTCPKIF